MFHLGAFESWSSCFIEMINSVTLVVVTKRSKRSLDWAWNYMDLIKLSRKKDLHIVKWRKTSKSQSWKMGNKRSDPRHRKPSQRFRKWVWDELTLLWRPFWILCRSVGARSGTKNNLKFKMPATTLIDKGFLNGCKGIGLTSKTLLDPC